VRYAENDKDNIKQEISKMLLVQKKTTLHPKHKLMVSNPTKKQCKFNRKPNTYCNSRSNHSKTPHVKEINKMKVIIILIVVCILIVSCSKAQESLDMKKNCEDKQMELFQVGSCGSFICVDENNTAHIEQKFDCDEEIFFVKVGK